MLKASALRRSMLGRWRFVALAAMAPAVMASALAISGGAEAQRLDGFNIVAAAGHPFGSPSARQALNAAKGLGAKAVAIIPFLWQPSPASEDLVRGSDMQDEELRIAIREARALGFFVLVKPHVWVPESWAGAVQPASEPAWQVWFTRYRGEMMRIARVAAAEGADALALGTELAKTTRRPEWIDLIAAVRATFPRTLTYVAHNLEEAEAVPFWDRLDAIGVSLYPALGVDDDRVGRIATMRDVAERLDKLSARFDKPLIVAEIGVRSAAGAAAKPWESAEERAAPPDAALQAHVLADWFAALDRPTVRSILVWRWLTDPAAGGLADTDFTVQGKPAERVLLCAWTADCAKSDQNLP
jgi:hypothetical protein